jgi:amidase
VHGADRSLASDELPSLLNITLEQVAEGLEGGKFTSVDLVKAYIARIEESNEEFWSVLEINPDAIRVAELLDRERSRSGSRG